MDAALRRLVRQRAGDCCEYCRLPQFALPASLQIEHIVARQHRGSDDPDNLALSCPYCNRFKGPNLSTIDQETGELVPLFHPRRDAWEDHFVFVGIAIQGLTATGRATVLLLEMNDDDRLEIRSALFDSGEI
jgi:5-methylcytosine-specific restriction endonuclease McrA